MAPEPVGSIASRESFKGKKVAVVGGDSPLGQAIAQEFTSAGGQVCCIGKEEATCHVIITDYSDLEDTKDGCKKALEVLEGKIDVLVNCAGNIIPGSMGYKEMPKVAQLNLVSAQMCSELLAPELAKSEIGNIVNVACAIGSMIKMPGVLIDYGVTKAGMCHMSRNLALQLAPKVRCNVVLPGLFEGDQVLTALAGGDEKVEKLLMENGAKATLLQRLGKPQEVAAAVFYIATQEGATGTEIVLDGGAALTNWLNHPVEGMVGILPDQFPTGLQESLTSHNKKRKSGA
jgi:3-oxoacyl-[acyl-carrier protein] reductase